MQGHGDLRHMTPEVLADGGTLGRNPRCGRHGFAVVIKEPATRSVHGMTSWYTFVAHVSSCGSLSSYISQPIYASHVNSSPQFPTEESGEIKSDVQSRTMRFLRPFHRHASSLPSPNTASMPPSSSPSISAPPAVRVAVLIAMPIPPQHRSQGVDGPPVVELGVAELPLQDTGPTEQQ